MTIQLNGEQREVRDGVSVADLLISLKVAKGSVAVEVNGEVLPKDNYAEHELSAADVLEIVKFMGGG